MESVMERVSANGSHKETSCMYPCPSCGGDSVLKFPAPKAEWLICERCEIRWKGGYGNLSCWQELTDEDFKRNAELLERTPPWTETIQIDFPKGE